MPVAHSSAHYINSSKGCPSITESFLLCCLLLHKMLLSPLSRHCQSRFAIVLDITELQAFIIVFTDLFNTL
jgi:hypothetical protein